MALVGDADGDTEPAERIGVHALDPLAYGPLSPTSPRMYADSATLTRILLAAGRRAAARGLSAERS
jgi:hypothetical protein